MIGDVMIGFRTSTPWKSILAIIYYSLCFAGFSYGVLKGISVLIITWSMPALLFSVIDALRKRKYSNLYSIPAFVLAALVSLCLCFFDAEVQDETKIATTVETVVATEIFDSEMVSITRYGNKYHKPDCNTISNRETMSVTLKEAVDSNKIPCNICFN